MIKKLKKLLNKSLLAIINFYLLCNSAIASGFDEHVFIESASFVLVAESQSSLASMFGHSFLKLEGKNRTHALSYYNSIDSSVLSYINVLIGNSNGIFVLMPYHEIKKKYIHDEKRSLLEFKLKLTDKEKENLKNYIKTLENKTDKYNFFYNNCNSQIEKTLSNVNKNYKNNTLKQIVTPLEYAKYLTHSGLVEEIKYIPAKKADRLPKIYEYPSVTKFSLGMNSSGYHFEFNPIYHDKSQTQSFEHEVDSRIFGISFTIKDNTNLELSNIDFFKLTSYEKFTTSIDLGYDSKFRSKFGIGTSFYHNNILLYTIPSFGFRDGDSFISVRNGISAKFFQSFSATMEYEPASDFNTFTASLVFQLSDSVELQTKYSNEDGDSNLFLLLGMYF